MMSRYCSNLFHWELQDHFLKSNTQHSNGDLSEKLMLKRSNQVSHTASLWQMQK